MSGNYGFLESGVLLDGGSIGFDFLEKGSGQCFRIFYKYNIEAREYKLPVLRFNGSDIRISNQRIIAILSNIDPLTVGPSKMHSYNKFIEFFSEQITFGSSVENNV